MRTYLIIFPPPLLYQDLSFHGMGRNIVGVRIREARKAAQPPITQTDLVARLQMLGITIDQSGLSKLESGQRPVSDIEVAALAKTLNVSISWLFEECNASFVS